jgi:hypothetical protein
MIIEIRQVLHVFGRQLLRITILIYMHAFLVFQVSLHYPGLTKRHIYPIGIAVLNFSKFPSKGIGIKIYSRVMTK